MSFLCVLGKPAYEMLECDADWAPSLHLGHDDIKESNLETSSRRLSTSRKRQAREEASATQEDRTPTPPNAVEMDVATPSVGKFLIS